MGVCWIFYPEIILHFGIQRRTCDVSKVRLHQNVVKQKLHQLGLWKNELNRFVKNNGRPPKPWKPPLRSQHQKRNLVLQSFLLWDKRSTAGWIFFIRSGQLWKYWFKRPRFMRLISVWIRLSSVEHNRNCVFYGKVLGVFRIASVMCKGVVKGRTIFAQNIVFF